MQGPPMFSTGGGPSPTMAARISLNRRPSPDRAAKLSTSAAKTRRPGLRPPSPSARERRAAKAGDEESTSG